MQVIRNDPKARNEIGRACKEKDTKDQTMIRWRKDKDRERILRFIEENTGTRCK